MVAREGFSLVEIIVALTLLSVAMLGIAGSGLLATRLLAQAELHRTATTRAVSILDSLVMNDIVGSGRVRVAAYDIEWSAATDNAVVRVSKENSAAFALQASK